MNIGKKIRELRETKGLTQLELSKDLNVARQTVAQWENEERDLKTGAIIALSKYFNVTADYLLGLSDVATVETDLAAVCEYTNFSEKSIKTLHIWAKNDLDIFDYEAYTDFIDTLISNEIIYTKLVDEFSKYMLSVETCRLLELENSNIDFAERNKLTIKISSDGVRAEINEIKDEYNKEVDDVQALQLYKMQNIFTDFIKGYGAAKKNNITSIEEIINRWQKRKDYYDKLQKFLDDNEKWIEERKMDRKAKKETVNNGKHTGAAE